MRQVSDLCRNIMINLQKRRKELGLTQEEAAAKLQEYGICKTSQTLCEWENFHSEPKMHEIIAMSDLYGFHGIDAFLNGCTGITREEYRLVQGFRAHPEMQEAVEVILGLHDSNPDVEN